MSEIYAAHIREDGKVQTVKEHLEGTATLARRLIIKSIDLFDLSW